jgi:hypothetical protein
MSPFVLAVAVLRRTPAVFVAVAVRCFHPKKMTKGLVALWTRADSAIQSSSVSTYRLEVFVRLRNKIIRITVNFGIIRTINRLTDTFWQLYNRIDQG